MTAKTDHLCAVLEAYGNLHSLLNKDERVKLMTGRETPLS
jgi:hypothetical protein